MDLILSVPGFSYLLSYLLGKGLPILLAISSFCAVKLYLYVFPFDVENLMRI